MLCCGNPDDVNDVAAVIKMRTFYVPHVRLQSALRSVSVVWLRFEILPQLPSVFITRSDAAVT